MKDQINTIRAALTAAANLIAHQYTGTSLGMTALQDASDDCLEALTALDQIDSEMKLLRQALEALLEHGSAYLHHEPQYEAAIDAITKELQ